MTLSPITELTLSNIFQAVLTEAYDRLQKDHAENDIHLNIMTERQAKREADLRQNLQVRFQRFVQLINYMYTIFSSIYTSTQFSFDHPPGGLVSTRNPRTGSNRATRKLCSPTTARRDEEAASDYVNITNTF